MSDFDAGKKNDPCSCGFGYKRGSKNKIKRKIDWDKVKDFFTPDKHSKRISEPIWTAKENPIPDNTKPTPPPSVFIAEKNSITNRYGYSDGLQNAEFGLEGENLYVKTNLDIEKGNVPGILSCLSFLMNNNDESSLSLSTKAQNFEEGFDLVNAFKGKGSEDTISKEEFLLYLQDYAREAVESGDEGNDFRNKAAVHFDKNKVELAKIFDAIAGKDEVISKEEFKNFWQDLFAQGEISNDNMTKITGEILNKYVNEKLVEQGEMPTFRKTDDEIEFMNKEMQLKELNVKIDPNLVKEIKYSEGGDIAFLILDDDTEIQFQKEAYIGSGGDGELNITKNEEGRYIIFSNKDRKCNTIIGKIAKIIPSENSKITLLNPKNIVYSSPGEIDDDVIIEGKAFGVDLIVGSGDDKIVNNTKSGVKIIKHFENDSVELQKKNDIAYTHVRNSETKNFYYSPQDDYVLARQMEDFDNFLQKATDGELIALANENGLEKFANEYNSVTSIEGEATSLTKKQRENLIKEIKSQQEKYFKDINKEAAKIEKEAEKAEKKAKKQ